MDSYPLGDNVRLNHGQAGDDCPDRLQFLHESYLVDTCTLINLDATGEALDILRELPATVFIASVVEFESRTADVDHLKSSGVLLMAGQLSPPEENMWVQLAGQNLDDGEAESAAISIQRGWGFVTDDGHATDVLVGGFPAVQVVSTPEILRFWCEHTHASRGAISHLLGRVESIGRFRPAKSHSLYNWWVASLE